MKFKIGDRVKHLTDITITGIVKELDYPHVVITIDNSTREEKLFYSDVELDAFCHYCSWIQYQGLTKIYEYCKTCSKRRTL